MNGIEKATDYLMGLGIAGMTRTEAERIARMAREAVQEGEESPVIALEVCWMTDAGNERGAAYWYQTVSVFREDGTRENYSTDAPAEGYGHDNAQVPDWAWELIQEHDAEPSKMEGRRRVEL